MSVAVRFTIIMARGGSTTDPREWAGRQQGAGPASPPYTPERNQILGIFAVSTLLLDAGGLGSTMVREAELLF